MAGIRVKVVVFNDDNDVTITEPLVETEVRLRGAVIQTIRKAAEEAAVRVVKATTLDGQVFDWGAAANGDS